jgi:hypothetical protein
VELGPAPPAPQSPSAEGQPAQQLRPTQPAARWRRGAPGSPHGDVLLQAGAEGAARDLPHLLAVRGQHLVCGWVGG